MTELVDYSVDDNAVAWITLNRPEKKNAMSRELLSALQQTYERYAADPTARAAVLRGAGDSFCAGGDITMFPSIDAEVGLKFTYEDGQRHYRFIDALDKPVIAAVYGYCLAGGFELALQCTFIVSTDDAKFGMEEARLGLIPGYGGTVRLLTAMPTRRAAELLLTADRITGAQAAEFGIVNATAADAESVAKLAGEKAALIASVSPNSVAAVLHVLRAVRQGLAPAFDTEALRTALLFGNSDTQERIQGVLARLQKR